MTANQISASYAGVSSTRALIVTGAGLETSGKFLVNYNGKLSLGILEILGKCPLE